MGLVRRDQETRRRRCSNIGDDERHRDRPQPPSARRVAAGRHRFLCRSSSTMHTASRRRRFANSKPSRSPQTSPYLWNETLLSLCCILHLGQAGLHITCQVGYDSQHPLDQHKLAPVMHFVLLDGKDHFKPALVGRGATLWHAHTFRQEFLREPFHPLGPLFSIAAQ